MKKSLLITSLFLTAITLFSCEESKENKDPQPSKNNCIEYSINKMTMPGDSTKIVVTTIYTIYKDKNSIKTRIFSDTLPALGYSVENYTTSEEDDDGNSYDVNNKEKVKNEYEIVVLMNNGK